MHLPQANLLNAQHPSHDQRLFQISVLEQIKSPKLVACDTMNFWIEGKNDSLMKIIESIDVLIINDAELCSLAKDKNILSAAKKISRLGPNTLVVKRGEFGAILFHEKEIFIVPAFQNLFSKFDASVGHYRRYEKKFFLEFAKKNKIKCIKAHYFDSIGYFIIIISKLFNFMNFYIHKNKHTVTLGIKFWNLLIPISKILDKILFNSVGKSLICIYQKTK